MPRPKKNREFVPDSHDKIIKRIEECETVLEHLKDCPAWKVIIRDLRMQEEAVDDNWHQVTEEKKLNDFRVTKYAVMHLKNIKIKYEQDLFNAKLELDKLENPSTIINKDYDGETIMER